MALCVFDEQQSWPALGQAGHHPGEAFTMKARREHKSPGSSNAVRQLKAAADQRCGQEHVSVDLLSSVGSHADLRCQKHDGGNVQQTAQLIPGSLSAGGQQGGGRPAAQGYIQALGHQHFQVQRHLRNPEDPVLQTGKITIALF